LLAGFRQLVPI